MAASTEVRVPFVDHHVAEAAFRLRGHAKIRDSRQKAALKDAAARWLPTYITDRSKASFGVPLRAWTRNELREVTHDLLPGGWLVGTGLINSKELNRILAANVAGKEDHAQIIWHLLTIELWHRALEDAPDLRARVAAPVALP